MEEQPTPSESGSAPDAKEKQFYVWRLLGVVVLVLIALAAISAAINIQVLGL
ncbi:MAG: hypothetical protein RLZZ174_1932 [Pseudomonadota bacterium]